MMNNKKKKGAQIYNYNYNNPAICHATYPTLIPLLYTAEICHPTMIGSFSQHD